MTFRLSSIEQLPRSLPIWQTILEDLGNPPPRRIARALGLGERTVYRYCRTGEAPKVVHLALFWLTQWGRSAVNAQAENDALVACGLLRSLQAEAEQLRHELGRVLELARFGSANDPSLLRAYFPADWPPLSPASPLQDGLEGEPVGGSEAPRVRGAAPSRPHLVDGAVAASMASGHVADAAHPLPRAVTRGERSTTGGKVIPSPTERCPDGIHGKVASGGRVRRESLCGADRPVAKRSVVGGVEGLPRRPTHAELRRAVEGVVKVSTAAGATVRWSRGRPDGDPKGSELRGGHGEASVPVRERQALRQVPWAPAGLVE